MPPAPSPWLSQQHPLVGARTHFIVQSGIIDKYLGLLNKFLNPFKRGHIPISTSHQLPKGNPWARRAKPISTLSPESEVGANLLGLQGPGGPVRRSPAVSGLSRVLKFHFKSFPVLIHVLQIPPPLWFRLCPTYLEKCQNNNNRKPLHLSGAS